MEPIDDIYMNAPYREKSLTDVCRVIVVTRHFVIVEYESTGNERCWNKHYFKENFLRVKRTFWVNVFMSRGGSISFSDPYPDRASADAVTVNDEMFGPIRKIACLSFGDGDGLRDEL